MLSRWYINTKSLLKQWTKYMYKRNKHKQQDSKFKFSRIYKTTIKMYSNLISVQHGGVGVQWLSSVWLCNPMNCSTPGFPVLHYLLEFVQTHVHWVSDAISSSIVPFSFSQWAALCMTWPKYWSFSFSTNPPSEYSELISFRINQFDLLAVQGTLKSLLQHHSLKASVLWCSAFFIF